MSKRICIAGGHSKKCPGASKYIDEYTEDRKVAKACLAKLKKLGYTTKAGSNEKATQAAELAEKCRISNAFKADLFGDIHFNACRTTKAAVGVECYYWPGDKTGKKVAAQVSKDLSKLFGIPNRGAKASRGLYVLRNTNCTAILPEVCFVDSKADTKAYKKSGAEKVGQTIANSIHKVLG